MFNKTFFKFLGGGIAIVLLGIGATYAIDYYRYRVSPEYQAQKYFEDLERRYREDTYGGDTPEETLQLFIDALKKGDIELASRYFLVDEQQKWRQKLATIKEINRLDGMITDLQKTELTNRGDTAFFTLVDEKRAAVSELVMRRNQSNNRWKIVEL